MEDKIMRKKLGIFLSLWLCISMILLPFASTQVSAAEANMATLNFDGASIENGKAIFAVDDAYKVRLTETGIRAVTQIVRSIKITCRSIWKIKNII